MDRTGVQMMRLILYNNVHACMQRSLTTYSSPLRLSIFPCFDAVSQAYARQGFICLASKAARQPTFCLAGQPAQPSGGFSGRASTPRLQCRWHCCKIRGGLWSLQGQVKWPKAWLVMHGRGPFRYLSGPTPAWLTAPHTNGARARQAKPSWSTGSCKGVGLLGRFGAAIGRLFLFRFVGCVVCNDTLCDRRCRKKNLNRWRFKYHEVSGDGAQRIFHFHARSFLPREDGKGGGIGWD